LFINKQMESLFQVTFFVPAGQKCSFFHVLIFSPFLFSRNGSRSPFSGTEESTEDTIPPGRRREEKGRDTKNSRDLGKA